MNLKMGRNSILITIIALLLIFSAVIYCTIKSPRIRGHLYTGDHITINLKVISNGQDVPLDDIDITGVYNNENVEVVSEDGVYKTLGKNHGEYKFELLISKEWSDFYNKSKGMRITSCGIANPKMPLTL